MQIIVSFFFQIFIANIFGIGVDLDIFFASSTINLIILAIASSSVNSAITPILIKHYKNKDYKTLRELANSFFNILFITFLFLAFIQYTFAEQILKVILPGFGGEKLLKTIYFFRIQAFLSIITISTALFVALYYTLKKFYRTVLIPVIGQIMQIIFVYLFHKQYGIYSLVYGLVLSQIISFVLLSMPFIKYYRLKIVFNKYLKESVQKIYPLIISSGFSKSNIVVDRFFASSLSSGSITLLQYGQRIIQMISVFINKGISIVSLRKFSLKQDDDKSFQQQFFTLYKVMLFVIIPVVFLIIFFLRDALQIIVLSNKISSNDVNNIYLVILAFIGFLIGGTLNAPITNAFYAKGFTKIISKASVSIQIFGIILKITLFFIIGFWGLPIAFSINSLLTVFVLLILYNRNIYKIDALKMGLYFLRILVVSAIAIIIPLFINILLNQTIISACLNSAIFIILYFVVSMFLEKDISHLLFSKINYLKCSDHL